MNTTPKCLYCGITMKPDRTFMSMLPAGERPHFWYLCGGCGSRSPAMRTQEDAKAAALRRYVEPNRVLTLDEVTGSNEPCVFLEIKGKEPIWACDCVISSNLNGVNISFIGDRGCTLVAIFDYCKTWRCWLRRPTDEERQSVAWEESE